MKLRSIVLSSVVGLAVLCSFAFNSKSWNAGPTSVFLNGTCTNITPGTDQVECNVNFTGAQCTVLSGEFLAYQVADVPTCSVPLRQPF
jgi:hypothetical protein